MQIEQGNLMPQRNKFYFEFEDLVVQNNRGFQTTTHAGIIIHMNSDDSAGSPRWVRVLEVGPDVDPDIKVGMRVCVEPLQWTAAIDPSDKFRFWLSDDTKVMLLE